MLVPVIVVVCLGLLARRRQLVPVLVTVGGPVRPKART